MEQLKIKAEKRANTGKNENNRLRSQGKIPVNIISGGSSTLASVDAKELTHLFNSGIRPATLIDLDLDGTVSKVFVKEVQRTPGTNVVRHIDFYKIIPGKRVKTKVGIEVTGTPKGVKAGGRFEQIIRELNIKSLSEDIKDKVSIDVTNLEVGQSVKIKDLDVPKSWEILINGNPIVAAVSVTKAMMAQEKAAKDAAAKDAAKAAKAAAAPAKAAAPAAKPKK